MAENNGIFFRVQELNLIKEQALSNAQSIQNEVSSRFEGIKSMDGLYMLSESIPKYKDAIYSIISVRRNVAENYSYMNDEPQFKYSILENIRDESFEIYPLLQTEFFFYLLLLLSAILIFLIIKKIKIPNIFALLLVVTIGVNFFNYEFKEKEIINDVKNKVDYESYRKSVYEFNAEKIVAKYYVPPRIEVIRSSSYSYDVEGSDRNFNNVTGEITTDGQYGSGHIIKDGERISVDVEWVGKGILEGKDRMGNTYDLEVE